MKSGANKIIKVAILGVIFLILLYILLFKVISVTGNVILIDKSYNYCSDNDAGINYNAYGKVTAKYLQGKSTKTKYFYDSCSNSVNLKEYYCAGNFPAYQTYVCANGCANGVCKTVVLPPSSVCGNNIKEGNEACDGTDSSSCPGLCLANCSCGVVVNPPTPPGSSSGIAFEAEMGVISSPFLATSGYIYQTLWTNSSDGGKASYNFTVINSGDYIIKAKVNAPDNDSNSVFINIDGVLVEGYTVWDILPTASLFENRTVSWRGDGDSEDNEFDPKVFTLTAGNHQLTIRGREPNVKVDKIFIEPLGSIPFDPNPASTLLSYGTSSLNLSIKLRSSSECRYALSNIAFDSMTNKFLSPSLINGSYLYRATIALNPDSNVLNEVYVRCAINKDYSLRLIYRSLADFNASFPRTGNLWGSHNFQGKSASELAKIKLWLGVDDSIFTPSLIKQIKTINPNVIITTSINTVGNENAPDDSYYLHDKNTGQKIEVWPGIYQLDMTQPKVYEYQAMMAYNDILKSNLSFDGCFFDTVYTSLSASSLTTDIYNVVHPVDTNGDGIADNSSVFEAAWNAGVIGVIEKFRELMPNAIILGHSVDINNPLITQAFNGNSIGFKTAQVLDGQISFSSLSYYYNDWINKARNPAITMIESSPIYEISYGYGYDWHEVSIMSPDNVEFAQKYYPYVRFGLSTTLMNDGYFAHEFGDSGHGQPWWYDELDYNLGFPKGPSQVLSTYGSNISNLITNSNFETGTSPWSLWTDTGYAATVVRDSSTAASGSSSAKIDVTLSGPSNWRVEFGESNKVLEGGKSYTLSFWAKSSSPRKISLSVAKPVADWRNYGLETSVYIGTTWQQYNVAFIASEDAANAQVQFLLGDVTSTVWLDNIQLQKDVDVYLRRDFDNGVVLLNPLNKAQVINVGYGFKKLTGNQAPKYEYIIDDLSSSFSKSGTWADVNYDSGLWGAVGPYYHDWMTGCKRTTTSGSSAQWSLNIEEQDAYTIKAWWPNYPSSTSWTSGAVYELVANNIVISTKTISQRSNGDRWQTVFSNITLKPTDNAFVRVRSTSSSILIADAIYVSSSKRYNDGSSVSSVKLQPLDGIILARV